MKFFNLVLSKFTFSGDTIDGYWITPMAIKSVADLKEHLFRQKNRDKEIILASMWSAIPQEKTLTR